MPLPYRPRCPTHWTPTPGLQSQGGSPIWRAPRAECLLPEHPDHTQGGCREPGGEQRGPQGGGARGRPDRDMEASGRGSSCTGRRVDGAGEDPPAGGARLAVRDSEKLRHPAGICHGSTQVSRRPWLGRGPKQQSPANEDSGPPGVSGVGRAPGCPPGSLDHVLQGSGAGLPGAQPSFPLDSFLPREGCPDPPGVDVQTMILCEPRPRGPAHKGQSSHPCLPPPARGPARGLDVDTNARRADGGHFQPWPGAR